MSLCIIYVIVDSIKLSWVYGLKKWFIFVCKVCWENFETWFFMKFFYLVLFGTELFFILHWTFGFKIIDCLVLLTISRGLFSTTNVAKAVNIQGMTWLLLESFMIFTTTFLMFFKSIKSIDQIKIKYPLEIKNPIL